MSSTRIVARTGPAVTLASVGGDRRIADVLTDDGAKVESFDTVESMLASDRQDAYCALVLRVHSTDCSIAQLIEPVTQRSHAPLVIVCEQIERWEVRSALAAGAAGVVDDGELDSTLAPCVHAVLSGQVCVPRTQWRQVEPPALSAREKQVLGLVVMGYMNGQIAEQLFLAESTVKSHLSSAFGKLGVRSRNEAVHLILDPERGLGMGIIALGGERLDASVSTAP